MEWLIGFLVLALIVWFLRWFFTYDHEADAERGPPPEWFRLEKKTTVAKRHILWAIRTAGKNGIGRGAIIEKLGIKGNKKAENSISYQLGQFRNRPLRYGITYKNRKYYY